MTIYELISYLFALSCFGFLILRNFRFPHSSVTEVHWHSSITTELGKDINEKFSIGVHQISCKNFAEADFKMKKDCLH